MSRSRSGGGGGGRRRWGKEGRGNGAIEHGGYHALRPSVLVVTGRDVGRHAAAVALHAVLPREAGVARWNPAVLRRDSASCGSVRAALKQCVFSFELLDSGLESSNMRYRGVAVLFYAQTHLAHLSHDLLEVDCGGG